MQPLSAVFEHISKLTNEQLNPSACKIIHNRKELDVTTPVRFANLPNGATLELKTGTHHTLVEPSTHSAAPSSNHCSPAQPASDMSQLYLQMMTRCWAYKSRDHLSPQNTQCPLRHTHPLHPRRPPPPAQQPQRLPRLQGLPRRTRCRSLSTDRPPRKLLGVRTLSPWADPYMCSAGRLLQSRKPGSGAQPRHAPELRLLSIMQLLMRTILSACMFLLCGRFQSSICDAFVIACPSKHDHSTHAP